MSLRRYGIYSTEGLNVFNGQGKQEFAVVGPVDTPEHLGKRKTTILHNRSIIDVQLSSVKKR